MKSRSKLILIIISFVQQFGLAQSLLNVGLSERGVMVFYQGQLPLPERCKIIRTTATGQQKQFELKLVEEEKDVRERIETMPPTLRYLMPLTDSAPREILGSVKGATSTDNIRFYQVSTIAWATGLVLLDESGDESCSYALVAGSTELVAPTKPTSNHKWETLTAKALGQNAGQSQVRLGWHINPKYYDELQGVIAYRGQPFGTEMEPLNTLRGFQMQGDSIIATVRDTTSHMMGSWHYGIRMINRFGAVSAMSDLLLAHNYPPGSRPYIENFHAIGSKTAPVIALTWKSGNIFRIKAIDVYRSRKAEGPFEKVYTASPQDTLYTDPVADVMEAYFYYLHVIDIADDEKIHSVTYPAVCEYKPAAMPISEISVDTTGRHLCIRWLGNGPGDRGYYVARTRGYDTDKLQRISGFIPATSDTMRYEYVDRDTSLQGDSYYTYGIISESHGYLQSPIVATAYARPNRPLYVPEPTGVFIRQDDNGNGATITWNHIVSKDYSRHHGYRVYARKKGSKDPYTQTIDKLILLDTNWYSLSSADGEMEYAIRAIDIYGNKSGFSLPCRLSEVFAQDFGPRFLRAEEVSETQTEIRWNTPLDKSITGYQLYMTDGESPSVLVGKFPSEQTSHRVATPKQPYVHYYFIVALDSNGNSSSASEWVAIK